MGFIFIALFLKGHPNRFKREVQTLQKNWVINIFKPLLCLGSHNDLMKNRKPFSRVKTEQLLERAGCPRGLKAEHIMCAKMVLPLSALLLLFALYAISYNKPSLSKFMSIATVSSCILYTLPEFLLNRYIRHREKKVFSELGLFSEIIFISLQAKLNLRDALEEAGRTTEYLRPYLLICLNEWHNGRLKALNNLKKNVGVLSFSMVTDLLIQAANVGDDRIVQFLEENKKLEDEIKNLEISEKNKTLPLLLTIQMILPLIIILIILFYPLSIQVENLITNFY